MSIEPSERVLDRRAQFDLRNRAYSARSLLTDVEPRSYTWACMANLDQGREGACVGFAWAHERAARPVVRPASTGDAQAIYHRAQELDGQPWPEGTSVLAGAKATQEKGWLREYRWAFTLRDALAVISRHGPCVLGVDWYEGMWAPDAQGLLHAQGSIVGGHAILATGVNLASRTIKLHNSWGWDWGKAGTARLSFDDFEKLLDDGGEVCVPVRR